MTEELKRFEILTRFYLHKNFLIGLRKEDFGKIILINDERNFCFCFILSRDTQKLKAQLTGKCPSVLVGVERGSGKWLRRDTVSTLNKSLHPDVEGLTWTRQQSSLVPSVDCRNDLRLLIGPGLTVDRSVPGPNNETRALVSVKSPTGLVRPHSTPPSVRNPHTTPSGTGEEKVLLERTCRIASVPFGTRRKVKNVWT